MTTFPLSSAPSDSASAASTGGLVADTQKTLDRNAFLQLLVAQLSNQDPMNPQDGHEFVAQLAQFSSVEQLESISETVAGHTQLLAGLADGADQQANSTFLSAAAGLVGQTVDATGAYTVWGGEGSEPAEIGFELGSPAADARVVIRNEGGQVVREIELGHRPTGRQTVEWDGLDANGEPAAAGTYTFDVTAVGPGDSSVAVTPFTHGRVDRVTIEPDGVRLWIGAYSLSMNDLIGLAA